MDGASHIAQIDLRDPDAVIAALDGGATASFKAAHRRGSIAELGGRGRLVVTGDLHDHSLNLRRAVKLAALDADPANHLVLHELVHGPDLVNGYDLSVRILIRVCLLKAAYPEQVLLLLSNHELAQRNHEGILKDGSSVVQQFEEGVGFLYHQRADDVMAAVDRYVESLLLGVRCANGIFVAHSLPAPRKLADFDPAVVDRVPKDEDLAEGGSAHMMVWGRRHTDALADQLAEAWGVGQFVLGHQPVDMGYDTLGRRILIINSDDNHGVALPIDLAKTYDQDALCEIVMPLNAVSLA